MEHIPETIEIKGKTLNLHKEDLPMAATFECENRAQEVLLVSAQGIKDENGRWEKQEGYVRIRFKGAKFSTKNSHMLKLMLTARPYERGRYWPDPEDPTGFWRAADMIQVKQVPVVSEVTVARPTFDNLDFKAIAEKKGEPVEPIAKVS